jgi:calcineurin-like phosphoesterase family protein
MDTWFNSDPHLGHGKIIEYCNRPFSSVEEMDDTIISNFNKKIKSNDILYCLGDLCAWYGNDLAYHNRVLDYRNRINCRNIIYIYGNHDDKLRKDRSLHNLFTKMEDQLWININGQSIMINHYAMEIWRNSHHGSWHLFGHSHCSLPDDPTKLRLDVGLEGHNYQPWHFDEIKEFMASKQVAQV